jgi:TPR repeat protein
MRIRALKTHGLTLLLARLACLSYVSGQETKAPASESLNSLRGRAEKGDARAQFNLGLKHGAGVPKDFAEAAHWYRKAADRGFPELRIRVSASPRAR